MQRLFHPQNTQNVLLVQPTSLFLPKECLSILILRGVYLWTSQESNKITQSGYYAQGVYNTVYYFQNTCVRSWENNIHFQSLFIQILIIVERHRENHLFAAAFTISDIWDRRHRVTLPCLYYLLIGGPHVPKWLQRVTCHSTFCQPVALS